MKPLRKSRHHNIDHLIREVLKDDLPPNVASHMKDLISRFHKDKGALDRGRPRRRGLRYTKIHGFPIHCIRSRSVPAAAALLMLLIGGVWQVSGFSGSLAGRLSGLGLSLAAADRVMQNVKMTCRIKSIKDAGGPKNYHLRWKATGETEIELHGPGNMILHKTIRPGSGPVSLGELNADSFSDPSQSVSPMDPMIADVGLFISPSHLADGITGFWEIISKDNTTITYVQSQPGGGRMEITMDVYSMLPAKIRILRGDHYITMEAYMEWEAETPPSYGFSGGIG